MDDFDFDAYAVDTGDAQELAKAIAASMLDEADPANPGPETMGLLRSIGFDVMSAMKDFDAPDAAIEKTAVKLGRACMVANSLAQIIVAIVRSLEKQGIDISATLEEGLRSPYRLG